MTKPHRFFIQSPGTVPLYTADVIWFQLGQRHQYHLLFPSGSNCLGRKSAHQTTWWYDLESCNHESQLGLKSCGCFQFKDEDSGHMYYIEFAFKKKKLSFEQKNIKILYSHGYYLAHEIYYFLYHFIRYGIAFHILLPSCSLAMLQIDASVKT